MYYLCINATMAKLSSCKAQNIHYLILYVKCLFTVGLVCFPSSPFVILITLVMFLLFVFLFTACASVSPCPVLVSVISPGTAYYNELIC